MPGEADAPDTCHGCNAGRRGCKQGTRSKRGGEEDDKCAALSPSDSEVVARSLVAMGLARFQAEQDDDESEHALTPDTYLTLRYFVSVVTFQLRAWDRHRLEGGTRLPAPPRSSQGKGNARCGKYLVIAFPTKMHMLAAVPRVGEDDGTRTWLPYLVAADPRCLAQLPEEHFPAAGEVVVAVGYFTPIDAVGTRRADFKAACCTYKRSWWDDEDDAHLSQLLCGAAARAARRAEVHMMMCHVLRGTALAALFDGADVTTGDQLVGLSRLCARCGKLLDRDQRQDVSLRCAACGLVCFCSHDCMAAAAGKAGQHSDAQCLLARVCSAAMDARAGARYGAAAASVESAWASAMRMTAGGRFTDEHCSNLLWDVTLPPDQARLVPGVVDVQAIARLWRGAPAGQGLQRLGRPLTADHLRAVLPVDFRERVHIQYFSHAVSFRADDRMAAGASDGRITVGALLQRVHERMCGPPSQQCLRVLTASFLRTFAALGPEQRPAPGRRGAAAAAADEADAEEQQDPHQAVAARIARVQDVDTVHRVFDNLACKVAVRGADDGEERRLWRLRLSD